MCQSNGDAADRSPAEQQLLAEVAEKRGEEFVDEHAELILTQARLIGDL